MARTIEDLGLVTHTCMMPESIEHVWEVTAAWLAGGLSAGERVVYFEDESADAVLERLSDDRVPVEAVMKEGQLVVVPTEATRASVATPLDQVEDVLRHLIEESLQQGWPGLRMNGETAPGMLAVCGLDSLVRYETIINRVLGEHPAARLLCLYDRDVFDAEAVAAMRAVHPSELVTRPIYDDTVLRVTAVGPGRIRMAGEVDRSNSTLIRSVLSSALDQSLRSRHDLADITLDLHSLRFLDVGGAVELVHTAERFPSTHRLVLTGVRPRLLRVLDRCGAVFADQLVVEPRPAL